MRKQCLNKRSSAVIVNIEKVCACYESFRSDYQLPSKALFFKEKAFVRQLGITSKANYPMFSEMFPSVEFGHFQLTTANINKTFAADSC